MSTTHRPFAPSGSTAADAPCDAPCAERSRSRVLAATILASSMGFIDGSVVHIALPAIQADLGASFAALQWVVNGYMLMLGALLLAGGALGDQAGRRRVFVAGIGLFVLASIACALAGDAATLIVARCIQGIGAALMIPQSLAIIAASFPRAVRGRAIGTWAAGYGIRSCVLPSRQSNGWSVPGQNARPDHCLPGGSLFYTTWLVPLSCHAEAPCASESAT